MLWKWIILYTLLWYCADLRSPFLQSVQLVGSQLYCEVSYLIRTVVLCSDNFHDALELLNNIKGFMPSISHALDIIYTDEVRWVGKMNQSSVL